MRAKSTKYAVIGLVLAALACNLPVSRPSDSPPTSPPNDPLATAPTTAVEAIQPLSPQDLDRSQVAYLTVVFDRGGGSPAVRGWYSAAADDPLLLPAGQYLVFSVSTAEPEIPYVSEVSAEGAYAYHPLEVEGSPPDRELAAAVERLALFLLDAEGARVTALAAASGGFKDPLFESPAAVAGGDLAALSVAYQAAASHEPQVAAALNRLEAEGLAEAPAAGSPLARPLPQGEWWDGIKDQFNAFFGEVSSSNGRAVERMRAVAAKMTPAQKEESFNAIPANSRGEAKDFDDMLDRAARDELPVVATNLEGLLNDDINYEPIAREEGQGAGQVLHQEGARLVVKGVELEVAITKTMLDTALPGISRGTEIADKINEYLEYAEAVYGDPAGEAEKAGREQLASAIADRLGEALQSCCAEALSEEDRQQLAEGLGGSIVAQVPEISGGEEAGGAADPASGSAGEEEGQEDPEPVTVSASGYFTESVDPSAVTLSTRLVLVADFENGYVSGNLTGSGGEPGVATECREDGGQGVLIDTSIWDGTHVYEAEFTTEFDPTSGQFSAPITIHGSTDWVQSNPYQNERCQHLNVGSESETWGGQGSLQGSVSREGAVTLTTSWQVSDRSVTGTFEAKGSVETP